MRNFKNALKHINKEELSSQKVELSITAEARKKIAEITKLADVAIKEANKVEQEFRKVKSANDKRKEKARSIQKEITKLLFDANKAAKDLGIDLPKALDQLDNISRSEVGKIPTSNQTNLFPN